MEVYDPSDGEPWTLPVGSTLFNPPDTKPSTLPNGTVLPDLADTEQWNLPMGSDVHNLADDERWQLPIEPDFDENYQNYANWLAPSEFLAGQNTSHFLDTATWLPGTDDIVSLLPDEPLLISFEDPLLNEDDALDDEEPPASPTTQPHMEYSGFQESANYRINNPRPAKRARRRHDIEQKKSRFFYEAERIKAGDHMVEDQTWPVAPAPLQETPEAVSVNTTDDLFPDMLWPASPALAQVEVDMVPLLSGDPLLMRFEEPLLIGDQIFVDDEGPPASPTPQTLTENSGFQESAMYQSMKRARTRYNPTDSSQEHEKSPFIYQAECINAGDCQVEDQTWPGAPARAQETMEAVSVNNIDDLFPGLIWPASPGLAQEEHLSVSDYVVDAVLF